MQLEIFLKIITTIATIFGVGNIFHKIRIDKRSQLREECKFIKDFLEEVKNNPSLHPLVLEKGYQAIAGTTTVSTEEMTYILSLKNPGKCLNDYLDGKEYLNKLDIHSDSKFTFKKQYSAPWSRKWQKRLYFTLYFISIGLAMSPLFIPQSFRLLIITIPVYISCALWFLDRAGRISSAERLVKNQQKYLSHIQLPSNNSYMRK